jgi:hypothetical protein
MRINRRREASVNKNRNKIEQVKHSVAIPRGRKARILGRISKQKL